MGGTGLAGGSKAIGGSAATGGSVAVGGKTSTGGASATGGSKPAGGTSSNGGSSATSGGRPAGGTSSSATGGSKPTGGANATGGTTSSGGSTSTPTCSSADTAYQLVWSDEFNGASGTAVDPSNWVFDTGGDGFGNSELEYYTDTTNNAAMDGNGNLVITAKKETHGSNNYTSARIKTLGKHSWTFGRIEARIKIPKGQGIWPAFWMLGANYPGTSWPNCGEIDIMENIGNTGDQSKVHATIHGPGYSGGSGPTTVYTLPNNELVSADYHVFALEWSQNLINWYLDSTKIATKSPSDIGGNTWVFNSAFFIILNLAVGGQWPGNPDATTTFPQQMLIDYVRVCQK